MTILRRGAALDMALVCGTCLNNHVPVASLRNILLCTEYLYSILFVLNFILKGSHRILGLLF